MRRAPTSLRVIARSCFPAPGVGDDLPGLGGAAVRARDRRRDVGLPDEATPARVLRTVVRTPRSAEAPLVCQVVLAPGGGLGLRHRSGGGPPRAGGAPPRGGRAGGGPAVSCWCGAAVAPPSLLRG